jgi:hypothetical protein
MGSHVISARARAYHRQKGLCCYCRRPTWLTDRDIFARQHGLTAAQADELRATAEHLVARQDDGGGGSNIAAACQYCNRHRHHKRTAAPSAQVYQAHVARRLRAGKWWSFPLPDSVGIMTGAGGMFYGYGLMGKGLEERMPTLRAKIDE